MKVYTLIARYPYESERIIGIFKSADAAKIGKEIYQENNPLSYTKYDPDATWTIHKHELNKVNQELSYTCIHTFSRGEWQ